MLLYVCAVVQSLFVSLGIYRNHFGLLLFTINAFASILTQITYEQNAEEWLLYIRQGYIAACILMLTVARNNIPRKRGIFTIFLSIGLAFILHANVDIYYSNVALFVLMFLVLSNWHFCLRLSAIIISVFQWTYGIPAGLLPIFLFLFNCIVFFYQ